MTELFKLTSEELAKQSESVRYQRMRYERSIEATLYVGYLRKGLTDKEAYKAAAEHANRLINNWENVKDIPNLLKV